MDASTIPNAVCHFGRNPAHHRSRVSVGPRVSPQNLRILHGELSRPACAQEPYFDLTSPENPATASRLRVQPITERK
jgi:hypothetical protein